MVSKYFEKYCSFYLSKYWVNKKKFENILKLKISKDFFQKKISSDEKTKYLKEIFEVIKFYDSRGFFDEEKLIELKIENLINKGYSTKKIKLFLKKNFFDERLIIEKIKNLELESDLEEKLIDKYLSKSGLSKKIKINMDKSDIEKILKKLLLQGFNYNQVVKYLKEKHNLYDYS
jgi:SOS response regulatory protein OraA/RecX